MQRAFFPLALAGLALSVLAVVARLAAAVWPGLALLHLPEVLMLAAVAATLAAVYGAELDAFAAAVRRHWRRLGFAAWGLTLAGSIIARLAGSAGLGLGLSTLALVLSVVLARQWLFGLARLAAVVLGFAALLLAIAFLAAAALLFPGRWAEVPMAALDGLVDAGERVSASTRQHVN